MIEMLVVLHLSIADPDTGQWLGEMDKEFEQTVDFEVRPLDLIEKCRQAGVAYAEKTAAWLRTDGLMVWDARRGEKVVQHFPNATINVDCQWEKRERKT